MARQLEGIEKGLRFFQENGDILGEFHFGTAVPNGLGDLAQAPIGSVYFRSGTSGIYEKSTNVGDASDWILNGSGSSSVLPIFRNIVTRAATNDTVSAGSVDPTAFSDNESGLDGNDFSVGEFLLGDVDGTPLLFEVTAVTSATDITVALADPALADNDGLIVRTYLPDSPAGQENTAGVMYQNGNIVKLFDVDWSTATAISLSAGYSAVNGTIAPGDSVESAIEKLDGNQQDLQSLSGVAQGSVDYGSSFTGVTIPDNSNTQQALQALESAHEEVDQNVNDLITLSGVAENSTNHGVMDQGDILSDNATTNALFKEVDAELTKQKGKHTASGVTTQQVLASMLVDEISNAKFLVTVENAASPANKRHFTIFMGHNGHAAADATAVDESIKDILKQGSNFNLTVSTGLTGAAGTQAMELRIASTEPSGVNVYAKRIETEF